MNRDSTPSVSSESKSNAEVELMAVPVASIDWHRSLPWWRLLSQSVSIAWRASHLLLAALASAVSCIGWIIAHSIFSPPTVVQPSWLFVDPRYTHLVERLQSIASSVEQLLPQDGVLSVRHLAFWLFGLLWTIGVWSFAGGLLARRSLMEMGVRTSVGWIPTSQLVRKRWLSMVWSICMPCGAIVGLALLPIGLGCLGRLGTPGQLLSLILMIPASLLAIGIGWCAAITAFGFPLSICAISAEKNADAFDGVSRAAAYLFQRPMTVAVMLVTALGLGWFGDWVIRLVLTTGEEVVWCAYSLGFGGSIRDRLGESSSWLHGVVQFTRSLIGWLQAAFLCSFFWSAAAAAYLTLRWEIDHTDFDELDLQEIGEPVALPSTPSPQESPQDPASPENDT